jgi:hypothetical protein
VVEAGTVLFVYVTTDARKMGVARKLTAGQPKASTS